MYGIVGKITAKEGKRDELIKILLDGVSGMPGCLSYIVAADRENEHALWITEVWEDEARHKASLTLPSVVTAIQAGRPLMASFDSRVETTPIGGHGLK